MQMGCWKNNLYPTQRAAAAVASAEREREREKKKKRKRSTNFMVPALLFFFPCAYGTHGLLEYGDMYGIYHSFDTPLLPSSAVEIP